MRAQRRTDGEMRRAMSGVGLLPAPGVALLSFGLAACDAAGHGCDALRALGRPTPEARAVDDGLGGTDCPSGLARCVAGGVEVSLAAHLPFPCSERGPRSETRAARCTCPWKVVAQCGAGCALEDAVAALPEELAERQLCAGAEGFARPTAAGDRLPACTNEEGTRCEDGVVVACDGDGGARGVGACLHGCEPGASLADGEAATGAGSLAILCRRRPAERP